MFVGSDGHSFIELSNRDQQRVAIISGSHDGMMQMFNNEGKLRVLVGSDLRENWSLMLVGKGGRLRSRPNFWLGTAPVRRWRPDAEGGHAAADVLADLG